MLLMGSCSKSEMNQLKHSFVLFLFCQMARKLIFMDEVITVYRGENVEILEFVSGKQKVDSLGPLPCRKIIFPTLMWMQSLVFLVRRPSS